MACSDDEPAATAGETAETGETTDATGDGDGDASTGDGDGDPATGDGDGDPGPLEPLPEAPVGEWLYVEIDGMVCRDGSPAGIAVRYAENSDLLGLYFQGGGACFNELSCLINPENVNPGQFDPGPSGGLFDNTNPDNPLMDYNWIFFPYCTGDVFFGREANGSIPNGPQDQMFVGHDNVLLAMERIVDTFPDLADVFLTGQSGGGFGAAANYDTIAGYFPNNDVNLVDDSGPIFRDEYLAPCLQQQWRDVWGIDGALPQDCAGCFNEDGGGLSNFLSFVQDKYPNATAGLISSHADGTISQFFGFGADNCTALFPSFPNFQDALYDLRDNVLTGDNFGTYYLEGNSHTYLSGNDYYELEVSGVILSDWVADIIAGDAQHVSP